MHRKTPVLALAGLLLQNSYGGCFSIFVAANSSFSAESDIHCRQWHQLLLQTPLKTRVKLRKQSAGSSVKKAFLEILQVSQENRRVEVSF